MKFKMEQWLKRNVPEKESAVFPFFPFFPFILYFYTIDTKEGICHCMAEYGSSNGYGDLGTLGDCGYYIEDQNT